MYYNFFLFYDNAPDGNLVKLEKTTNAFRVEKISNFSPDISSYACSYSLLKILLAHIENELLDAENISFYIGKVDKSNDDVVCLKEFRNDYKGKLKVDILTELNQSDSKIENNEYEEVSGKSIKEIINFLNRIEEKQEVLIEKIDNIEKLFSSFTRPLDEEV